MSVDLEHNTLPAGCEVVELVQPYTLELAGNLAVSVRWTFACHHPECDGKDMRRSGAGWLVAQAITAAQIHTNTHHQDSPR